MRNQIDTIKVADIRTKTTCPQVIDLTSILLMYEPSSHEAKNNIFRLAIQPNAESIMFLTSQKVYPIAEVMPLIPHAERLVCIYSKGAIPDTSPKVISQNLTQFLSCDIVENFKISELGTITPELTQRKKTLAEMKSHISPLKYETSATLKDLVRFDRHLTCLQERGLKAERSQRELSCFEK